MKSNSYRKRYTLSSKHSVFSSSFVALFIILVTLILAIAAFFYVRRSSETLPSNASLYKAWENRDYPTVYESTSAILGKRPLDGAVLAMNGFSAYYLQLAQTDPSSATALLDAAIVSMRNAWYRVSESERPQIAYILGKAYYQRGYYYADLAQKYLEYAWNAGVRYPDLEEYRGLAASVLGDYSKAIVAFTDALANNPSDLLLFTIAATYRKTGDIPKAKQYYSETIRSTKDESLELRSRNELAMILVEEGDTAGATAEFTAILEKDANFADAHYGLGVIYETQGDLVRARAEWRKTIRLNPVHPGAREKLKL